MGHRITPLLRYPGLGNVGQVQTLAPYPSVMVATLAADTRWVKWRTSDNVLWATNSATYIHKSTNDGASWVSDGPQIDTATYGPCDGQALMVTSTGRLVAATAWGYVLITGTDRAAWSLAFEFANSGHTTVGGSEGDIQFGYGQSGALVWLGAYDGSVPSNAYELYLSQDSGATWAKILDLTVESYNAAKGHHIHDVCYDSYRSRFWVVGGDDENAKIMYSDDLGSNWTTVTSPFAQCTAVLPLAGGLAFGTDSSALPDGVYFWPGGSVPLGQPMTGYQFTPGDNTLLYFGEKGTSVVDLDGRTVYLMPFYNSGGDGVKLLASLDGLKWYKVWDANGFDTLTAGLNVVGLDSQGRLWGTVYHTDNSKKFFTAPMPRWASSYQMPASITNLAATAVAAPVLTWTVPLYANTVAVYRDGVKLSTDLSPYTATYTDSAASANTAYTYTVVSANTNGSTTSNAVAVTTPAASTTVNVSVAANGDDWCRKFGVFEDTDTEYWGDIDGSEYDGEIGNRFLSVAVPKDSTITAASISVVAHATAAGTTPWNLRIYGVAADSPAAPTTLAQHNALTRTTAYVDWAVAAWTAGTRYTSPDIKTIIQEIVNRAGWASGQNMILLLTDQGVGWNGTARCLRVRQHNLAAGNAAGLSVTYAG